MRAFVISLLLFTAGWPGAGHAVCERVITLSPALTEIAFSLGLEARVVGVSRFVDFPPAARSKEVVGGLLDPHIEKIVALRPDAIFAQREQEEILRPLTRLKAPLHIHDHQSVAGILESIRRMGEQCAVRERASALLAEIQAALDAVKHSRPAHAPRVMVMIAEEGSSSIGGSFWVSGSDGFYSELLQIAGGQNVNAGHTVGMATLSMEGVMSMRPEVVLIISTPGVSAQSAADSFAGAWRALFRSLPCPRVQGFEGSYAWVPGPRFTILLRDVQRVFQLADEAAHDIA